MNTENLRNAWHSTIKPRLISTLRLLYFPSNNPSRKRRWAINIGKITGHIAFAIAMLTLLVFCGAFGKLPTVAELRCISNSNASNIYSADNKIMGRVYYQNRISVDSCDISRHVVNALVATEDSRFFTHHGIDFTSIARVMVRSLLLLDTDQGGGSTISQQLAKNLYPRKSLGPLTLPVAKIKELIIASRLEDAYTKDEILTLYLNTVPFGENVYGIEAASQRFFSRKAKWLDPPTAATLIGMLAANTAYNPRLHPDKALARRNTVLDRMAQAGFIDSAKHVQYKATPITLKYNRIDRNSGLAPHFKQIVAQQAQTILDELYGEGQYNIYSDGLSIKTTINSTLQRQAERAVQNHIYEAQKAFDRDWKGRDPWGKQKYIYTSAYKSCERYKAMVEAGLPADSIDAVMHRPVETVILTAKGTENVTISPADSIRRAVAALNAGFLAIDPHNGDILAWVGGANHRQSQTDHVSLRRQVGSTFKPILYAAAIESGMDPATYISNTRHTYTAYNNWSPANADGKYGGYYSLKGALSKSLNTISAWLINEIGPQTVVDMARKMGIESDVPALPSIALGTAEISLYEMVKAYSAFSNGGYIHNLTSITSIKDADGNTLYSASKDTEGTCAMSETTSIYLRDMLTAVVDSGTARSMRANYKITTPLAGKTGTTQNGSNGWFIGITPNMVAGAWVGCDIPSITFRSSYYGQGAYMALPIVGRFMHGVAQSRYMGGDFPASADEEVNIRMRFPMYSDSLPDTDALYRRARRSYYWDTDTLQLEAPRPVQRIFDFMRSLFGKRE